MENKELLIEIFRLECQLFMKIDSYRFIERKRNKQCLNPDERQQLNNDIHQVFKGLIKIIKDACPKLTQEDVVFCCLVKSGLVNLVTAGYCMGIVNRYAINQRKYRIKMKMKEAEREDLFELIFDKKKRKRL
ncbi:MAG: hypothetical protein LBK94_00470 [Prevotellaceae bacterium]|jgi:hypothetical protein|nr:hypothetical protein [Prevotellaceae bacterium]